MFALGAIVSLCYVPGMTGAFIATQWPLLSALLPFVLWRSGPFTALHWAGLAFLAFAAVRIWHAPIPADSVFGFWLVCIMALSFWLGSTLTNARGLYAGLALGASVSSAIAACQALGYQGVPFFNTPAGLFYNGVASGIVAALVIVALVSERMWLWVPGVVPGLVLSGSRGAWFALAVGLASTYVRRVWLLPGAAAIVGAYLLLLPLSRSDAIRMSIWASAVDQLTWFGWGPGSFTSWLLYGEIWVTPDRAVSQPFYPEYAHNDALQLAFEYGIVAVLPIGLFAFVLSRTGAREWPVLVTFAVLGFYSMPLWTPVASFLACVLAGRVVRDWPLVRARSNSRRSHVLSRYDGSGNHAGLAPVPVVSHS